jgi:Tfp pilus assembly protein PilX
MGQEKNNSRGFTLIAALLILVLLSGVAAGLLYLVTNESKMGGNDLEANQAFYGAESGMEKLTVDLATLYQQIQVPSIANIQALQTSSPPTSTMVNSINYSEIITVPADPLNPGYPSHTWNTISAGSNQGLYAEIIPITLQVIAQRPEGASVNITRQVEIALIPVFQFGVFCGFDCSYFAGPNFGFGGRVHTNQNLFLASGADLVFNDKISAFGDIVLDQLENGHQTAVGYTGTIYGSSANGGCALNGVFPPPNGAGTNCFALNTANDASWSGGYPHKAGAANGSFAANVAGNPFNGYLTNSTNGATNMQLTFVKNSCVLVPPPVPCTDPIAIVRKPQTESPTGALGSARLYNKAQIRILLADTQGDLAPERPALIGDPDNIQMNANFTPPTIPVGGTMPFATANTALDPNWLKPWTNAGQSTWTQWPLLGEITTLPALGANPAANGAWLRVEYLSNTTNAWVGVTREWLGLGFGKANNLALPGGGTTPAAPNTTNTLASFPNNKKAILILQQLRPGATAGGTLSTDWYPINFYDTREGEMRDTAQALNSCAVNGIMNVVDLDVGNLGLWLKGTIGSSGPLVNYNSENGYVLYFSDHRGQLPDPNPSNGGQTAANAMSGESGLEDVVNSGQNLTTSIPDGILEGTTYYGYSPEDVDQNGLLDNWGARNIGYGFNLNTNTGAPLNPYVRNNSCSTQGAANMVTGARHGLRLVDGGMNTATTTSYLPVRFDNGLGGFTVASENPVYVYGDYNSGATDPFWGTATLPTPTQMPHSAASIIADAVTVLSNQWSDSFSMTNSTQSGGSIQRKPTTQAYYRMAVAGGKNIPFPSPGWANAAGINDFGTDGGMHNFLRYLENWGGVQVNYNGSMVSMYYAEYATGTFKCCTTVYSAPPRNFHFDTQFLNPANLPPATPEFQDIDNLTYHQNFTPR